MEPTRRVAHRWARIAAALAYATGACFLAARLLPKSVVPPVLLIAIGLPLVFRLIPRNYLYGMRTPRTLWTTDEVWYVQNMMTGVAMVAAGIIWLVVLALR